MKDKLMAVVAWCFMLLFSVILACGMYAQMKHAEAIILTVPERNIELEEAQKRFYDSQTAYYTYCLKDYMKRDEESDYVYNYENWCREELGLEW